MEKKQILKEKEKPTHNNILSKHLKRIYPIGLQRSSSSLSLSSGLVFVFVTKPNQLFCYGLFHPTRFEDFFSKCHDTGTGDLTSRCNWITKNSGKLWCCAALGLEKMKKTLEKMKVRCARVFFF